eukprot:765602-Hanusia_phi.AAC.2
MMSLNDNENGAIVPLDVDVRDASEVGRGPGEDTPAAALGRLAGLHGRPGNVDDDRRGQLKAPAVGCKESEDEEMRARWEVEGEEGGGGSCQEGKKRGRG